MAQDTAASLRSAPLWWRLLPRRCLSRLAGRMAALPIPRRLRSPLYRAYARRYGADLGEIGCALADLATFGAFFARPLRPGARTPEGDEATVVSPADGTLVACGPVRGGLLPQIKGHGYTVEELLDGEEGHEAFRDGSQATVYLAPGDYHRVHAPLSGRVLRARRVPGDHYPVNLRAVGAVPRLFARNTRVLVWMEAQPAGGPPFPCAVVLVGALNVGAIALDFDPSFPASWTGGAAARRYREGLPLRRGEELGRFHLGSTVVALFPPQVRIGERPPGTPVRAGHALGAAAAPG